MKKLFKRVLSLVMIMAMLLPSVLMPTSAESEIAAEEKVTVELAGYAGYGAETSTGKHFAFSTAATTKAALAGTSWFAGAAPSTNYGTFTTLTGKVLVDGVEEDATLRFNASGSALYIEKSQTYLEAGKEIVLPKENVFTVTKSNGGTLTNGGQIQFAKTYALTYDTATQKPVLSERVIVELTGYAGYGTETSTGKHYAFNPSDATKTALTATGWFAGASATTNYGSFTTMKGKILVDGVEEEATLRFNKSGSGLYIEKSQTYLEAGKVVVIPEENAFTVTQSNGGTIVGNQQIQFARTYKLTYDAATQKPVLSVELAAKEKVTVELDAYAWMSQSSVENGYGFTMSADTNTALTNTSWFGNTSGGGYGTWTRATGKVLVDGVETEVNIVIQASRSAIFIGNTVKYLTEGHTVVIPKDAVFTVNRTNGGTLENGGQIQFAENYKLTYDAASQKPILSVEIATNEKVVVELTDYAGFGTETSTGKHYAFSTAAATKTALTATSWFAGNAPSTSYGSFTALTGKIFVDNVETEATLRFNPSGSALYIEKSQTYLEASKTIVLPKANVFTVTKSNGGTLENGGQIQFAKSYKITYNATTQKAILGLDPADCTHVWDAAAGTCTLCKTECSHANVTNDRCDTCGHTVYTVKDMQVSFDQVNGNNWSFTFATDTMPQEKAYLKATAVVDGETKTVYFHYYEVGNGVLAIYPQCFAGGVAPTESFKLEKDTILEAWTAPNGSKLQGVPTYRISQTLEVKNVGGVWLDSSAPIHDMQVGFDQVGSNNTWNFSFTTDTLPQEKAYLKATAIVDGETKTVYFHYYEVGNGVLAIYPQCFAGGVAPTESFKLEKDTILEAWTAPSGSKLQGVPTYRISQTLEVKNVGGVWLDSSAPIHDMQVGFDQVGSNNTWNFSFTTDTLPQEKAYLKATAVVDGETKTVYFHYYEVGNGVLAIYPQCFAGGVAPTESFKLEKDTILEAWTAPNGSKLQGVPTYRISQTLEVSNEDGVWLDSTTQVQNWQIGFKQVDAKNNWQFTLTADPLPAQKAYLKGTAIVDGENKTVYLHYYEVGNGVLAIYPQCFAGGVVPTESFKLKAGTLLEAYTAPGGSKLKGVYKISENLEVKKENGVWLDSTTKVQNWQIGFKQVDAKNNWQFTLTADPLPAQKAYLKGTAIVDGENKTVYFHYYEVGNGVLAIYPQCFAGGVVPTESFKLKAGTLLEAYTAPSGSKLEGVYKISEDLEVNNENGVWLDSTTEIQDIQLFFEYVVVENNNWFFTAGGEHLPEGSVYLQTQALVDGVEQKVFFHNTGTGIVCIYSQCFTKQIPTESLQLLPGTMLVQYTTPNSGPIAGAPVLRITNETTVNKAEGILWIGSSTERAEQKVIDPINASISYAGNTQNMLWLRVTTNNGKKLKEIYGNRQVLKGTVIVGLLNEEKGVTEYKLENVTFQVLEGSLYVSTPGLNAVEMVKITAGTVLVPADGASSDRALVIKNDFFMERNARDKWEVKAQATDTPYTGDSQNPVLLIVVMTLSLIGMASTVVVYTTKKKKSV